MKRTVSIIGGINIDIKGIADSESVDSDSHPGQIHFSPGGVGRNIAENLSLLGLDVKLFGCVGDDEFGRIVLERTGSAGVNCDGVIKTSEVSTSVYLSVSNNSRDFHYAVNDTQRTSDLLTADYVRNISPALKESSMIVLDTNLNADALNEAVSLANENRIPVFIDVVSAEKSARVKDIEGKVDFLSVNKAEFRSLFGDDNDIQDISKLAESEDCKKYKVIILKKDKDGADVLDIAAGKIYSLEPIRTDAFESNGAGDAFNAGFIFSILSEEQCEDRIATAGKFGICASWFALRSYDSVSQNLTRAKLMELYEQYVLQ
jgi:pseudouridine kinase